MSKTARQQKDSHSRANQVENIYSNSIETVSDLVPTRCSREVRGKGSGRCGWHGAGRLDARLCCVAAGRPAPRSGPHFPAPSLPRPLSMNSDPRFPREPREPPPTSERAMRRRLELEQGAGSSRALGASRIQRPATRAAFFGPSVSVVACNGEFVNSHLRSRH